MHTYINFLSQFSHSGIK